MSTSQNTEKTLETAVKEFAPLGTVLQMVCRDDFTVRIEAVGNTAIIAVVPTEIDIKQIIGRGGETVKALQYIAGRLAENAGISAKLIVGEPTPEKNVINGGQESRDSVISAITDLRNAMHREAATLETSTAMGSDCIFIALESDNAPLRRVAKLAARGAGYQLEFL